MKKLLIVLPLLFSCRAFGQETFTIKDASKYFDIKVTVSDRTDTGQTGKTTFDFFKKGVKTPYQVITLPHSCIETDAKGAPNFVNVGDFNFDGMEDVALCNGTNGSYGLPSYSIYLSSRGAKKFVFDKAFSELGSHLGMFETDAQKKVLRTFDKSGCCWHVTEEFAVVDNRPKKILEIVEDATIDDDTKVKVTTKRLVEGRWRTEVRHIPRSTE